MGAKAEITASEPAGVHWRASEPAGVHWRASEQAGVHWRASVQAGVHWRALVQAGVHWRASPEGMPLWGPNRIWPGFGLVLRCLGPSFTVLALGPGSWV